MGGDAVLSAVRLAQLLDARLDRLEDIARSRSELYRPFKKRRNGKTRVINQPLEPLKSLQKMIYRLMLRDYNFGPHVHAGVPNKSIFSAVLPHLNRAVVVTADIRDFYPGISQSAVYYALRESFGHSPEVARLLATLTTQHGCLPQGAPTSMALANLVMVPADLEINLRLSMLRKNLRYTRWVDDLMFSGDVDDPQIIFDIVSEALRPLGLKLHRKRTKRRVMRRHHRQSALGLGLNGEVVAVPRPRLKQLRAAVHQHQRFGRGSAASIMGRLEFIRSCDVMAARRIVQPLLRVAEAARQRRSEASLRRYASRLVDRPIGPPRCN